MIKKALITGISGYIGSSLAKSLLASGWTVAGVVRKNTNFDLITNIVNEIELITYDGTVDSLINPIVIFQPTVIFNLASCFLAEHRPDQITDLVNSNILFGTHLLEAMHVAGAKKLVNTGTSWQHYQNQQYSPVCLYAATKEAFEQIIAFYVDAYDFKVITLELFDTYGPGDPRKKLINLFYNYIQSGEQLIMSQGEQELDLVYIDDVISAYIKAYQLLETDEKLFDKYLVCTGNPASIKSIAKVFADVYQKKLNILWGGRDYRKREVMQVWDGGNKLPDWKPFYDLVSGLEKIKTMLPV